MKLKKLHCPNCSAVVVSNYGGLVVAEGHILQCPKCDKKVKVKYLLERNEEN